MRPFPFLVACLLAVLVTFAADAPREAEAAKTGLAVGTKAPSFNLKDQQGREVTLEFLLKNGPVAVVFYRSADW